jgi:hypothetical protein
MIKDAKTPASIIAFNEWVAENLPSLHGLDETMCSVCGQISLLICNHSDIERIYLAHFKDKPKDNIGLFRVNLWIDSVRDKIGRGVIQSCRCGRQGPNMCDCYLEKPKKPQTSTDPSDPPVAPHTTVKSFYQRKGQILTRPREWILGRDRIDLREHINKDIGTLRKSKIPVGRVNEELFSYIRANMQPTYPNRDTKLSHAHNLRLKYYENKDVQINPKDLTAEQLNVDLLTEARVVDEETTPYLLKAERMHHEVTLTNIFRRLRGRKDFC